MRSPNPSRAISRPASSAWSGSCWNRLHLTIRAGAVREREGAVPEATADLEDPCRRGCSGEGSEERAAARGIDRALRSVLAAVLLGGVVDAAEAVARSHLASDPGCYGGGTIGLGGRHLLLRRRGRMVRLTIQACSIYSRTAISRGTGGCGAARGCGGSSPRRGSPPRTSSIRCS